MSFARNQKSFCPFFLKKQTLFHMSDDILAGKGKFADEDKSVFTKEKFVIKIFRHLENFTRWREK
jgi:hypothetical protein